jgi:hypothetical protein
MFQNRSLFSCFQNTDYQLIHDTEPVGVAKPPINDSKKDEDLWKKTIRKINELSQKLRASSLGEPDVKLIVRDYVKIFDENENNISEVELNLRKLMDLSKDFEKNFFKQIYEIGKQELSQEKHTKLCRHMVVLI